MQIGVNQVNVTVFAIMMDVIMENAREGLMNEILYADDLVLMSKSLEKVRKVF